MKFDKAPSKLERGTSWVIYADPGVGKTTMASTLPQGETLFISTEAGIGPLMGTDHSIFNLIKVASEKYDGNIIKAFDDFLRYLKTKNPFKYYVLDNLSELEQLIIQWLTTSRRMEYPGIKEYAGCSTKCREIIHDFRDMTFLGNTVVMNAWENLTKITDNEGCVETRMFPKITDKISREMCGLVDFVGRLEVHEKSGKRWVRFGPTEKCITKKGLQGLDDGEVPDFMVLLDKVNKHDYTKGESNADGLER